MNNNTQTIATESALIESATRAGEMINYLRLEGDEAENMPEIFYLCGFYSNIQGSKIQHLIEWAQKHNRALTCFDYRGHGESDGDFTKSCFTQWFNDALQIFETFTKGKQIIIGSSMGGWMAMNLLKQAKWQSHFQGAILLAPAPDFMTELFDDEMRNRIRTEKKVNPYEEEWQKEEFDPNYVFTETMLNDAPNLAVLHEKIKAPCPIHVLQGDEDTIVPPEHGRRAFDNFIDNKGDFHLIAGGDHSLSRPEDLELLTQMIESLSR